MNTFHSTLTLVLIFQLFIDQFCLLAISTCSGKALKEKREQQQSIGCIGIHTIASVPTINLRGLSTNF